MMGLISYCGVLLLLLISTTFALVAEPLRQIEIFAWPQTDAAPQTLAHVSYNTTFAIAESYHAPKLSDAQGIVRVGFHHNQPASVEQKWSGIATAASNFAPNKDKTLQLLLNSDGNVYHVGFKATVRNAATPKNGNQEDAFAVEVVPMRAGSTVHLNKPVVLNAEGKPEDAEPEKTFLQKYWWAIAGFLVLQVVTSAASGEGGKK